jgi:hypothetical protein
MVKCGCSLQWLRLTRPDWDSELWRIVIRENIGFGPHLVMAASQTIGPSHMPSATGTTAGADVCVHRPCSPRIRHQESVTEDTALGPEAPRQGQPNFCTGNFFNCCPSSLPQHPSTSYLVCICTPLQTQFL